MPGTLLAGRYRIISRLGQGGMGEVYRADDEKLGQPVALKFLPRRLQGNQRALELFLEEVRLARRVAHPNVCRVFDLGEHEGLQFITMEYVDGEDLGRLLRRIGRAPRDKAVQIGWQLCAGLAAIHDQRILHRDLKPANVMLDGRGRVRITDFGVAGRIEDSRPGSICGTPEYMAPEQLAGKGATLQSDLYSLGLLLYEIFTGRRVFASSEDRLQESKAPPDPDKLVQGLDPKIGSAIRRCLEPDPRQRPESAAAVLVALPGGDPLRAFILSGETPSPEIVAASGTKGRISVALGVALSAIALGGTVLIGMAAEQAMTFRRVSLENPPEVLAAKAKGILTSHGHRAGLRDRAFGFGENTGVLKSLEQPQDAESLDPVTLLYTRGMYFWYRVGSEPLVPDNDRGRVGLRDPPVFTPGTATIILTPGGELLEFQAGPPAEAGNPETTAPPDLEQLFADAGLVLDEFKPATPRWTPSVAYELHRAWKRDADGGAAGHVEAAFHRGKLVFFRSAIPWTQSLLFEANPWRWGGDGLYQIISLVIILGCLIGAHRNVRRGSGDRKGATRLAIYIFSITLVQWVLVANHSREIAVEGHLLGQALSMALYAALLLCWFPYVALEPAIRRLWPGTLVSWTRLLSGRIRDPLVGRDLLIGICGGVLLQLIVRLYQLAPGWMGLTSPRPQAVWPDTLLGPGHHLAEFLRFQGFAVFYGFALLFLLLVGRFILRNEWMSAAMAVAIVTAVWYGELSTLYPLASIGLTALRITCFVLIVRRFGVLAVIAAMFLDAFLNRFPITFVPVDWYLDSTLLSWLVVIGLTSYAAFTAVAQRPSQRLGSL
jgi:serine/threonine-protein kinase